MRTLFGLLHLLFFGSCTCILRLIRCPAKPGKTPSFLHFHEGILPWSPISFFTSWYSSPWCGCASCSSGHGRATPLPCARQHRSPHPHGPSAAVNPHRLLASPTNRPATPVRTLPTPTRTPPQLHP